MPPSANTPARPSIPRPMPERRSSSRRVSEQPPVSEVGSIDIHHLIRQQQQLRVLLPRLELGTRIRLRRGDELAANRIFFARWMALQHGAIECRNPLAVVEVFVGGQP